MFSHQGDGSIVPVRELDLLEVAVITVDVSPGSAKSPIYRNLTSHKEGGYNPDHRPYEL